MLKNFEDLRGLLAQSPTRTLVVAAAHDLHTLEAVKAASAQFPMKYILVGDGEKITEISQNLDMPLPVDSIMNANDDKTCAEIAVRLIREGRGDVLMKGILDTGTLLKAALDKKSGIRESSTMSHLAMLEVPDYHKLLAVTDAGMLPHPDLGQKVEIVNNAVIFLQRIGVANPKIAAVTASEKVNGKMPETEDAAALQAMCGKGEIPGCRLEGPLSFDLAVSAEAARIKGVDSDIAGDADVLLVPGVATGNIMCKALYLLGRSKMAGCILGAKAPIVLVSRGATSEEKLLSIMLCLCA